ncbi:MAG: phosphoribosylformylglycinamidine synthase subunit PurS [Pseudomonadota bacterium]|jgi:phosphoribosylformylglycinamidine synthase PurS subunit
MRYRYQVLVRLKEGVLDVQGKAVENGLNDRNYSAIKDVRVGRVVELNVEGVSKDAARAQVEEVCKLLLANPVIEQYEIKEVA